MREVLGLWQSRRAATLRGMEIGQPTRVREIIPAEEPARAPDPVPEREREVEAEPEREPVEVPA